MRILGLVVSIAVALGCHRGSPSERTQQPSNAVAVGAPAPAAELTGTSGGKVALADLIHQHAQTVVVFYRGFW